MERSPKSRFKQALRLAWCALTTLLLSVAMPSLGLGLGLSRLAPPGYPGVPPSSGPQLRAGLVSMWELEGTRSTVQSQYTWGLIIQESPLDSFARPYPAKFPVSVASGTISKLTTRFNSMLSIQGSSCQILIVSPAGTKVILMSGVNVLNASSLINFDDSAATSLPQNSQPVSGSYKPTTYGGVADLPAPAPGG